MGLLEIDGVDAGYGNVPILRDVSLALGQDEVVAIIGANGAGKTTLMRVISGHIRASAGSIRFQGQSLDRLPAHRIVDLGLVQVPEGRHLFPYLTVEENLLLGAYSRRSRSACRQNLAETYALIPRLSGLRSQLAGRLSGGEQQMCAIGRALMAQPRLLLLDEPSLGLAPTMVESIFATLSALKAKRMAMLLVEQNFTYAAMIADRGYVVETGRIVHAGDMAELQEDESVIEAYFGVLH